jgi:hypothetical protein
MRSPARNSSRPRKVPEPENERPEVTDLELARAIGEVREVEARLRVAPENDRILVSGLKRSLEMKKERVERLRAAIEEQVRNADLSGNGQKEIAVEGT